MKVDDVITITPKACLGMKVKWLTFDCDGKEISVWGAITSPTLFIAMDNKCCLIDVEKLARRAVEIMREDRS